MSRKEKEYIAKEVSRLIEMLLECDDDDFLDSVCSAIQFGDPDMITISDW